jgi:Uma2 family endonuclease
VGYTDGYVEVLPFPTSAHQKLLKRLFVAFSRYFEPRGGEVFFGPMRLQVRPGKYRVPDLLLLVSSADSRNQHRYWQGADLVLEIVSPEKRERDLVDKRKDYADGKVAEYWIVDPQMETITVLQLAGEAYHEAGIFHRGESARSSLRPDFAILVDGVFDAGKK